MKRLFRSILAGAAVVLTLATGANADVTCNGCIVDTSVVSGNLTMSGNSSAYKHVSQVGNLTVNGSLTGIEIRNSIVVGTPTLNSNATTDQWATTGTVGGTGTPSEAAIALAATPFLSATDFRLKSGSATINNATALDGHVADIMGLAMQGAAWDIGCYEFVFGGGGAQFQHGFEHF